MPTHLVLLRGINVGGRNKVPMADLRTHLEAAGFQDVTTYIASGNVILRSKQSASKVRDTVERLLPQHFRLDVEQLRVHVLSHAQLRAIVDDRPPGFGDQPERYHSDVIFLMGLPMAEALRVFDPREGVDTIWPGKGVIYSQRLSAERTRSRLNKVIGSKAYQSMTIRNWNTTTKLLELLDRAG